MPITINGSGTLTGISAGGYPDATVTADDLAATLDLSGKTVTLPAGVGGKILNVATVQINSTAGFNNSGSHARFAAMDSSYTTTATGSKIIVIQNWLFSTTSQNADMNPKIFRKIGSGSASEIIANPSPVGSTATGWIGNARGDSFTQGAYRNTLVFLDTPGHTSGDVITYEHHWRMESSQDVVLNRGSQTSNNNHATTTSHVIFMEVA